MFLRERLFSFGETARGELSSDFELDTFLELIETSVSNYQAQTNRGSKHLQESILSSLERWGVETEFKFQPVSEKSQANFELDFLKSSNSNQKNVFLGGELAFDNRQAIFTNVVKVDLAMRRLIESSESSRALSILVTFCQDARSLGNWDGSVATFEEYSQQLQWGLERYLTSPLLLIGLAQGGGASR